MLVEPGKKLTIVEKVVLGLDVGKDLFVAIMLAFIVVRGAIRYGPGVFSFCYRIFGLYGAQGGVALLVVLVGFAAHRFKQKRQRWYGLTEVAFGAVSGVSICFRLAPGASMFSQWAALVGCTYVIARGLNNIAEAKMKGIMDVRPAPSTSLSPYPRSPQQSRPSL
jgi:hypothetical protein